MMTKKPTVAHSVNYFLFLTGSWIYNLLINAKNTRPIVFAENEENKDVFPFNNVYCEKNLGRFSLRLNHFVANKLSLNYSPYRYLISKFNKIRLLHSHFGNRGYSDIALTRKLRIPHITTFYGYDAWRLPEEDVSWRERYGRLFEHGDLFLAEGPFMLKRLIELGCKEERARVLRIGVDIDKIEFIPRKIGKEGFIKILIASTFTEKKGIPYALEAIGKLKNKHNNIRVVLIGDCSPKIKDSNEEKKKILNILNKYQMDSIVTMCGFLPHSVMIDKSRECHLFLSPSVHAKTGDSEGGSPVSITEASAAGMPVVSTYHCDIPEIIVDGKTGLLAKEKDVDDLAMRLRYLIEDPGCWVEMGEAGRRHVEEEFNLLKQVNKLENIYSEYI